MGLHLSEDAEKLIGATSSEIKAYYAALICNVPKGAVISVSADGSRNAVIQHPEACVASVTQNAVTDLRSLRDALAAQTVI